MGPGSMVIVWALLLTMAFPAAGWAQVAEVVPAADAWQAFAHGLDTGTEVRVHLRSGQRFRAALVEARQDVLVIQPLVRSPVPPQAVPYAEIQSLALPGRGVQAAKAAGIGVGVGAGTFFGLLAILLAAIDD